MMGRQDRDQGQSGGPRGERQFDAAVTNDVGDGKDQQNQHRRPQQRGPSLIASDRSASDMGIHSLTLNAYYE